MYNTIRLLHNKVSMTAREYKEFEHGDTLFGVDRNPEVLAKWVIEDIIARQSKVLPLLM